MRNRSIAYLVIAMFLHLGLNAGLCAQQSNERTQAPGKDKTRTYSTEEKATAATMTDEDRADMAYVQKLPRRGTSGVFDLSDPRQFRFLLKQWELAGLTRSRRPQLFKAVERLRQEHRARRGNAAQPLNAERDLSLYSTVDQPIVPINMISSFGNFGGNTYSATAYTSVSGTLQTPNTVATTTIGLYDQNFKLIGNVVSAQQWGGGFDMRNTVAATIPAGVTVLYAEGSYMFEDSQGHQQSGPLSAVISIGALKSAASRNDGGLLKNASLVSNAAFQGGSYTMLNQQPTDVKQDGIIKVCIVRNDPDCDYIFQTIGGKFIVQFPIQATFTIPENLQSLANQQQLGSIDITVSQPNANQGAGCTLPANFNFWNGVQISGSTMTWLFNPGPFSNPQTSPNNPCFPSNSTVVYNLSITVVGTNPQSGGTDYFFGSITSRDNPPPPPPGGTFIKPMVVAYGCIAEGTLVTMADGSRKKIEDVGMAQRVISRMPGESLNVASYTYGMETKPMFRLTTANGHSILLTETHPVMTAVGAAMAKTVKVGDELITEEGLSAIASVNQEEFHGSVWNLSLGDDHNSVTVSGQSKTFFANGVMVGDGYMQRDIELAERQQRPDLLSVLPRDWRQDYLNYLAETKAGSDGARHR